MAERKPVTVLYCALAAASARSACLELETMYHAMQIMGAHAQEVARHYEGTMIHVTGTGITLLFGAPVAYEDHARRAVWAALELRHRLHISLGEQTLLLTASMGLHTGLVIVGRLSQTSAWMYTGVGDTTHLAIQLQQQATPGGILLSAATYRLVQEEIQGAAPVPIEVDGTHTPAYAIQGCIQQGDGVPGAGICHGSRYVGRRERDLALLHERLVLATQRRKQMACITGTTLPSTRQEISQYVAQQLAREPRDSASLQPLEVLGHEAVYETAGESDRLMIGATMLATRDCTSCVCQEF
jgi:class 3 adenylate cyclase